VEAEEQKNLHQVPLSLLQTTEQVYLEALVVEVVTLLLGDLKQV
tara:strand:+ start:230 stop:361 length:132 start_codon:yes stop_codon:yes gene_type:complete